MNWFTSLLSSIILGHPLISIQTPTQINKFIESQIMDRDLRPTFHNSCSMWLWETFKACIINVQLDAYPWLYCSFRYQIDSQWFQQVAHGPVGWVNRLNSTWQCNQSWPLIWVLCFWALMPGQSSKNIITSWKTTQT